MQKSSQSFATAFNTRNFAVSKAVLLGQCALHQLDFSTDCGPSHSGGKGPVVYQKGPVMGEQAGAAKDPDDSTSSGKETYGEEDESEMNKKCDEGQRGKGGDDANHAGEGGSVVVDSDFVDVFDDDEGCEITGMSCHCKLCLSKAVPHEGGVVREYEILPKKAKAKAAPKKKAKAKAAAKKTDSSSSSDSSSDSSSSSSDSDFEEGDFKEGCKREDEDKDKEKEKLLKMVSEVHSDGDEVPTPLNAIRGGQKKAVLALRTAATKRGNPTDESGAPTKPEPRKRMRKKSAIPNLDATEALKTSLSQAEKKLPLAEFALTKVYLETRNRKGKNTSYCLRCHSSHRYIVGSEVKNALLALQREIHAGKVTKKTDAAKRVASLKNVVRSTQALKAASPKA